jgi:hypothetical protein
MSTTTVRFTWIAAAFASVAGDCRDDGFVPNFVQRVGVTAGDFDDVAAPFQRMDVQHDVFEGLISTATWDEDFDPDDVGLKVEELFVGGPSGGGSMGGYQAVFVASGTRGFGVRQYNGLGADDMFVQDDRVAENVARYAGGADRALFVTDWAYELIELGWPDAIDFLGADLVRATNGSWTNLDAAQHGLIDDVVATVEDPALAEALGGDTVGLAFPYSNQAVIEDVGPDVKVLLRGPVRYRLNESAEVVTIEDAPLLVAFQPEGENGAWIYYATFHIDAQPPGVIDAMLPALVGEFETETGNVVIE